jgi:hypothetical protein
MKCPTRELLQKLLASVAIPVAFFAGSGVAFFSCLLLVEYRVGHFERPLTLGAIKVALWAGFFCSGIALLAEIMLFWVRHSRDK